MSIGMRERGGVSPDLAPGTDHRAAENRRRRIRRLLIICSLPVTLAGLLLAGKLLMMSGTASTVVERYDGGAYLSSETEADGLLFANWFDPWLAFFDRGTARAAGGDLNPAIDDLEKAFALATGSDRCVVAVNLSLSWETLGDSYLAQGQLSGAQQLYATAQAVIDAAGPSCAGDPQSQQGDPQQGEPRSGDPQQDAPGVLSEAEQRLEAKQRASQGAGEQQQSGTPQQQLDQLQQQNEDAAGEKAEQEGEDRIDPGLGQAPKPW